MAARPGLHAQFDWTGGGLSSVSNFCPSCTYLKTLIGKARYGAEWGIPIMTAASPGGGRAKGQSQEEEASLCRGCCRFSIPDPSSFLLGPPLSPPPICSRGYLLCVRGIAHQWVFPGGNRWLRGLWVGVGKDVEAAWPSIFNSSGDFFRAPCHRLTVIIIAGQSHRTHQSKPNGTLFCSRTSSCRRWPAFWRSARKRP
ncbi:hypothetical protein CSHISOI_02215 [Colletotrichum shisoi]|uniref:Uncharacterized protein n=1 Tax=Colletotrichum shisoi TaxID=2078593 RepID=A0A5Q4C2J8_9PEZI|nr:hypothetical protein CSHISOI_02215 [Colletotrichum shisoi]